MVRVVESYLGDRWRAPQGERATLYDATHGTPVAEIAASPGTRVDPIRHARTIGGPNLRALTFHQRAAMLKAIGSAILARKEELYSLSTATGATRRDSWIDIEGGAGVLLAYASKGRRELPDSNVYVDGDVERLARDGSFLGCHIATPLTGVALHVNAFNFPCWGLLEKLAPALLAGVPVISKPASQTAYLAEALVRLIADSGVLPPGALQLVCGPAGDLVSRLDGTDVVAFTGSAATAHLLRADPAIVSRSVRFNAEADSLNAAVLGRDATPGTPEFDLFVAEVVNEMTTKAGQKCTAIRRIIAPAAQLPALRDALAERLSDVIVGDPADETTQMGPLASHHQRDEVLRAVAAIRAAATPLDLGTPPIAVGAGRSAFVMPTLLVAGDPTATAIHQIEAFGPVATLVGYTDLDDAVRLVALGGGSLVASVFTADHAEGAAIALGVAPHHGRVLRVDATCGRTSTGHGSPLPALVHGGPGRAGGGEEMGGLRGVMHYMQRTAIQGSPDAITAITGEFQPGATRRFDKGHPFRLHFEDLEVGDALDTGTRTVGLDDIESFAALSGDRFYAHMDEEAAAANPIFDGRVAHGYFVLSAAAGLFVDPDPGPVIANYGLDRLRFATPTYPGDTMRVEFTCKRKTPRPGTGYGEVAWATTVVNQKGEVAAAYDVLTLVATREGAPE